MFMSPAGSMAPPSAAGWLRLVRAVRRVHGLGRQGVYLLDQILPHVEQPLQCPTFLAVGFQETVGNLVVGFRGEAETSRASAGFAVPFERVLDDPVLRLDQFRVGVRGRR